MKKVLIFILVSILAIGGCVGAFFFGRFTAMKKVETISTTEGNTTYKVQYLKDSYVQGELLLFEITVTSDVKFTTLSISIDNEADQELNVKTGESKDLAEENQIGTGKNFVKSNVQVIDTTDFAPGWYPVVVKATDAEGSVYVLTTKPILVQITAPATTEAAEA